MPGMSIIYMIFAILLRHPDNNSRFQDNSVRLELGLCGCVSKSAPPGRLLASVGPYLMHQILDQFPAQDGTGLTSKDVITKSLAECCQLFSGDVDLISSSVWGGGAPPSVSPRQLPS